MGLSIELISDGKIIDQNLKQINLDRYWLEDQLKAKGINDPSEVFLAVIDTQVISILINMMTLWKIP